MTRLWSIRARTTLTFAVASMVLTAAVVLLVTWGSTISLSDAYGLPSVVLASDPAVPGAAESGATPTAAPPEAELRETDFDTTAAVVQVALETQWQWAAVGVLVSGLLAGLTGWTVSRRVLRPVDRITATTRRLSASTLHERIALEGPDDELRRLARTVDDLLDRLETAFEAQRRFVAQASHELRTPLAVQRAALQVGLSDGAAPSEVASVREELLEQNRRTEHLVESLLVLAEADRGLDGRTHTVDTVALAEQVVHDEAEHARGLGRSVSLEDATDGAGGVVTAEPVLARQLLANLVDNAVEYNEHGGSVVVRVLPGGVEVENSGPPVDPAVVDLLVEPFRRDRPTRPGRRHSGLGLSIVSAVARAHGWRLELRARADGGLVVRVIMVDDRPGGVSSTCRGGNPARNVPSGAVGP